MHLGRDFIKNVMQVEILPHFTIPALKHLLSFKSSFLLNWCVFCCCCSFFCFLGICIFGRNGTKRSQVLHGPHQEARDIILSQYWWCPLWSLGQVTLFYPSTDDVHFDHLVSAKVLHWKVTVSPFLVFKYLTGWYSETILFCLRSSPSFFYHSLMILAWISFSNGYKMVVGEPLV